MYNFINNNSEFANNYLILTDKFLPYSKLCCI
jgi:hypothetical protein